MRIVANILDLIKERKLEVGDGRRLISAYTNARHSGTRSCPDDRNKLDVRTLDRKVGEVQNHLSRLDMHTTTYPARVGDGTVSGDGENKKIVYQIISNRTEMLDYLKGLLND